MSLTHRFAREDAEAAMAATFEQFWSLYPRKVGKLDAMKAWAKMSREFCPAEIIEGLRRNLPAMERKEKHFIKHPGGWLRDGRWMDEPSDNAPPTSGRETDLQRLSREMRERNGSEYHSGSHPSVVPLFPGEWQGR